jgi:hypothetical protein
MEIKWAGHVECTEMKRNAYRILEVRPERNKLLGGPSHRWAIILKRVLWSRIEIIWLRIGRL